MPASRVVRHFSVAERRDAGRKALERVPLSSHKGWMVDPSRADPVSLLEAQNVTRDADLVPVRHGRMSASPFTFYRGAARIMAEDLKDTPTAGFEVQLCGDAHLSNFGLYASPERSLVFDLNDFDETLPGPFEYDVKRMAASFTIAAQNNGFSKEDRRAITRTSVRAYREAMRNFAQMGTLETWYARISEDDLRAGVDAVVRKARKVESSKTIDKAKKRAAKLLLKAHSSDSLQALSKLAEVVDGRYRIVSNPPVVVPLREVGSTYGVSPDEFEGIIHDQFRAYRTTLQYDRRHLLQRYEFVDAARKVVGVGSVGTRAFIILLQGRDDQDPLFLQLKEATSSVLESHLKKSRFTQPGERVVQGQRMMQASSDIFLGWTKGAQEGRYLYWRQLRDMKGSFVVEDALPVGLDFYAGLCGWTLARAHARSGDAVAIAEYLGDTEAFDKAIGDFSERYAEQNGIDFNHFEAAIRFGRIQAIVGV
jgi:uncharacterized protein (DUF2252 family)